MVPILHKNCCDGCGRTFDDDEEVVALISHVIISNGRPDGQIRLKLSTDAINTRATKVFCKYCIQIDNFIVQDK